jgi:predicted NBD/HSP70 family sugar kinase
VPAPVDVRTGRISSVGVLRGWDGAAVPELLGERLGLPVYVDNDSNLGALAEVRLGAARGRQHIVYIHASHGVGGGLVIGGEVFHGRAGGAGEIGHSTVDDDGPVCRCGSRGCLEMYVGAPILLDMLRPSHGNLTLRGAITRAEAGDVGCRRVIADAGRHLGAAAADVCNLFDPELVVIGGELADAGELLLEPIRTVMAQRAVPSTAGPVQVVAAELGAAAEVRGALAIALDRVTIAAPGTVLT